MEDPNLTMEEYIRFEEEKARRRGKVYYWETAKYGKIGYDEDVHDLRSVKVELPAIVLNDTLTSEVVFAYEPTVCPLDYNKIDFRISFDESDDEDCMSDIFSTVLYDVNPLNGIQRIQPRYQYAYPGYGHDYPDFLYSIRTYWNKSTILVDNLQIWRS
ncbi:hypothetical protein Tco_1221542 [Tanacetum coccineum]